MCNPTRGARETREKFDRIAAQFGMENTLDVAELMYNDPDRADVAQWLNEHGWRSNAVTSADEMRRLGRWVLPPEESDQDAFSRRSSPQRSPDRGPSRQPGPVHHRLVTDRVLLGSGRTPTMTTESVAPESVAATHPGHPRHRS